MSGAARWSAESLRAAFDAAFAEPAAVPVVRRVRLLCVRAGGQSAALRLDELAGLHRCPPLMALPGAPPGLLGVGGWRDRLLAVWDLAVLLGWPGGGPAPRWCVRARAAPGLALAFDDCEGSTAVAEDALAPAAGAAHCAAMARLPDGVRPVADVRAIVATVGGGPERPPGEDAR